MIATYLSLKLLHIFIAIVALGTSAGLGIILEFYVNDPAHESFVLRAVERIIALVVLPGYVLMLVTGLWMANLAWPFTANWMWAALGLWVVGFVILAWSLASVRKQHRLHTSDGPASGRYRRVDRQSCFGRRLWLDCCWYHLPDGIQAVKGEGDTKVCGWQGEGPRSDDISGHFTKPRAQPQRPTGVRPSSFTA
jgi:uncharacterized membrane protein